MNISSTIVIQIIINYIINFRFKTGCNLPKILTVV
uniref:Uncharacterized protein n=1 Tax=Arundo donax TaxID=35708 RepID=A0A0A9C407_ARUDO